MLFLADSDPSEHVRALIFFRVAGVPITLHTVTLAGASAIILFAMTCAAKSIATGPASQGNERYITKGRFAQMIEAITIYLRDQMLVPVMGEKTTRQYLPYLMTLFFFI